MARRIAVLLGVVLFAVLLWRLGPVQVLALAARIRWYALVVLVCYAAHDVTRALALQACVLRPGALRFVDAFAIRLSGDAVESLTFTGPLLAEPTRAWLLQRRGLTLTEGFAATITEYLICTFVGAAMAIAALSILVSVFHPAAPFARVAAVAEWALAIFLVVAAVAIWRRIYLIGHILRLLSTAGLLRGRFRPDLAAVTRMEELLLATLHGRPARVALVAGWEAVSQACLVLELFTLMRGVVHVGFLDAFVVEGAMKIVGTVFLFVPLQVGVAEGSYAALFGIMGLSAAAGFAVVLLRRARSLVAAGLGLAVLARLSRERSAS